ncbi:MAG: MarR family transcriptional regulator [Candidatus Dormibacteraeota bacterium]|nr:MarR family transcriptional regulator [Candidatus Dormibacteraeota bacterium]
MKPTVSQGDVPASPQGSDVQLERHSCREAAERLDQSITVLAGWTRRHDIEATVMQRAKCSLPASLIWLLARLVSCGPCHPSDLASWLGVDNSTITPKLQRLEGEQLVLREPDPEDRRAALVRATPTGVKLLNRLRRARADLLEERLQTIPAERQATVVMALSDLADLLAQPQ